MKNLIKGALFGIVIGAILGVGYYNIFGSFKIGALSGIISSIAFFLIGVKLFSRNNDKKK